MTQTILITGSGGFIGGAVLKKLANGDHSIVATTRKGTIPRTTNFKYLECNLLKGSTTELIKSVMPNAIIHCAAEIPLTHTGPEAIKVAQANRIIDKNIINFCSKFNCRLIYASSTSVYSNSLQEVTELTIPKPQGPYAQGKLDSETEIIKSVPNHTILRINAPFGVLQRNNTVVKIFIKQALGNLPLKYHGSGNRKQDFTYIQDVADAFLIALNTPNASGLYNISAGVPITMKDLATLIVTNIPGCKSQIEPSGQTDPEEYSLAQYSIHKAREILHWVPKFSIKSKISELINALGKD